MRRKLDGWSSTQRRDTDRSITSEQSVRLLRPAVEQSEDGARELGSRYWRELAAASHRLLRCREDAAGVEVHLPGGLLLLGFGPAETSLGDDLVVCRYPIRGGLLARRGAGALRFSQRGGEEPELRMAVTGFHPRWSGSLYELVQKRVHVAISRRYLCRLTSDAPP